MISLVELLSDRDLQDLADNEQLLDATRKAAKDELLKRENNDL